MATVTPNWLDRFALAISPSWGRNRLAARAAAQVLARHYEAASGGRRTTNWNKASTDGNAATGPALPALRALSRDLLRNNGWAKEAKRTVVNNTVGWGILPKPTGRGDFARFVEAFTAWAKRECDADARLSFYGLQSLVMGTVFDSGETLIRRRWRRPSDGLSIPLQLQVLEPDLLDTSRDGVISTGKIVGGVEFDKLGRRVAYWLFEEHPGSSYLTSFASRRIPASEIIHVCPVERAGQVHGAPWLAAALVSLKDFDDYEDADLVRAKIAACFAGFTTDVNGGGEALGEQDEDDALVETFEPGMIVNLPPGRDVKFGVPPLAQDNGFSVRTLRRIAAAVGVTYEDMTGDYSQVNFSSARMGRIKHWSHVYDWRWNMLVPQFCDGVWAWAVEAAVIAGLLEVEPQAEWTAPPMPMIEPDKEGLAAQRNVRSGMMTPDEMVREQGKDPDAHWAEYAASMARLDELGITIDCDARKVSQTGQVQSAGSARPPSE